MKRKILTSLILTLFMATMLLCFVHTAMMVSMTASDCVLSADQSMCPLRFVDSWGDLLVAGPEMGSAMSFLIVVSMIFLGLLFDRYINSKNVYQPIRLYSRTYPNFSSLNFLTLVFRRGILHPKLF